ncbi:MAG: hypothetical protein R2911_39295 [Caldilineaceae bacterium]
MDKKCCPYLGTLDEQNNQNPSIDYPSFENHCFAHAASAHNVLILADQATYCLGGGHPLCPRYQTVSTAQQFGSALPFTHPRDESQFTIQPPAAFGPYIPPPHAAHQPFDFTTSIPLESELLHPQTLADDDAAFAFFSLRGLWRRARGYDEDTESEWRGSRQVVWLAAASFVMVFLCGIGLSLYMGWQLMSGRLLAALPEPGNVDTLQQGGSIPRATDLYIVITATPVGANEQVASAGDASVQNEANQSNSELAVIAPTATYNFPQAVTATPMVVDPNAANPPAQNPPADAAGNGNSANNNVILPPSTATPVPEIDVQVIVPTPPERRPTPDFVIPSSTPGDPEPTPTVTATWPPPVVIFGPDKEQLLHGECTLVRWNVENVRAVYYENLEAKGKGEKEECLNDDENIDIFTLTIVLPDGATDVITSSISLIPPTVTPTPSLTFTPLPNPTATWTPIPPTPTPTSDAIYGTNLALSNGASPVSCTAGQSCEIGLITTNSGNQVDTLSVLFEQRASWDALLCRQDGVCSNDRLVLSNVGPGNTAYVVLRVVIPTEAAGQSGVYAFRAVSDNSGDAVMSDVVSVQINVQ